MSSTVLISIINWNSFGDTHKCLNSLMNLTYPYYRIRVIDNGSQSVDDITRLSILHPTVSFTRNDRNLGFTGAHNQAIQCALHDHYDYVWLLNNDCIVFPDTLDRLVAMIDFNPRIGIVSPLILLSKADNPIQFCGSWFDWGQLRSIRATDPAIVREREQSHPQDMWLAGTAILVRCNLLKTIGGLDNRYFAYFEDNDLCIRASRRGFLNRMAFDVPVIHNSFSDTHSRLPYYFYLHARNEFLFWTEHTPKPFRHRIRQRLLGRILGEARWLHDHGKYEHARACIVGLVDALQGRYGCIKESFTKNALAGILAKSIPYKLSFALEGRSSGSKAKLPYPPTDE
ncbi:MAG: glycosyltransferase family 2 protein [Candidatus Competibacteraceae bacterium]